jgi:lipopolysaccharide transport system permease protein
MHRQTETLKHPAVPSSPESETWTLVITPASLGAENVWRETWRYRELVWLFFRRDFVAVYKQTVLGPLWFLLQPLMTTTAFSIVFGKIAAIPTDGVSPFLFYMSGVVLWSYFAACLQGVAGTFSANSGIFGKVYFPRLVMPLSLLATSALSLLIQFSLFLFLLITFKLAGSNIHPNLLVLATPLLVLHVAAMGLGFGLWITALTTKYRDLTLALGFGVQLWMYATPIVYPLSQVPEVWRPLFLLNPMAPVVELFRYAYFGVGQGPTLLSYVMSILVTVAALSLGVRMFRKAERTFLDTI